MQALCANCHAKKTQDEHVERAQIAQREHRQRREAAELAHADQFRPPVDKLEGGRSRCTGCGHQFFTMFGHKVSDCNVWTRRIATSGKKKRVNGRRAVAASSLDLCLFENFYCVRKRSKLLRSAPALESRSKKRVTTSSQTSCLDKKPHPFDAFRRV